MMLYWIAFAIWLGVMLALRPVVHGIVDNYGLAGTAIALAALFFIACVMEGRKQRREANRERQWKQD